jgi:hypothetical protein
MIYADKVRGIAMAKFYLCIGLLVIGSVLVFYGIWSLVRRRFLWPFSRDNGGLWGRSAIIAGSICLLLGIGAFVVVYILMY